MVSLNFRHHTKYITIHNIIENPNAQKNKDQSQIHNDKNMSLIVTQLTVTYSSTLLEPCR